MPGTVLLEEDESVTFRELIFSWDKWISKQAGVLCCLMTEGGILLWGLGWRTITSSSSCCLPFPGEALF